MTTGRRIAGINDNWWIALVSCVVGGVILWHFTHRPATPIDPFALATLINASSCEGEPFQIISRLDKSKAQLFDCTMQSGKTICVTEQHGIASNVTLEARLLWANTLGASKPACLS